MDKITKVQYFWSWFMILGLLRLYIAWTWSGDFPKTLIYLSCDPMSVSKCPKIENEASKNIVFLSLRPCTKIARQHEQVFYHIIWFYLFYFSRKHLNPLSAEGIGAGFSWWATVFFSGCNSWQIVHKSQILKNRFGTILNILFYTIPGSIETHYL